MTSAGFSGITFNIDINGKDGKPVATLPTGSDSIYGNAILASINSTTKIEFKQVCLI